MQLYPIKFKPIVKEKIWGGKKLATYLNKDLASVEKCGESWEISGVPGDVSVVANGFLEGNTLEELIEVYMGDVVGDKVYEQFGHEFPLLIKFIDASDVLSIQVHPDDKTSKERHNAYGKTEMWYVLQADEGAELISGFSRDVTKEEYLKHLEEKNLKAILNYEAVAEGDVFFIPSGRVHAIGAGIVLTEIQQTSDVTYRIYDWDRKDENGKGRELHTDLAVDVIDYKHRDDYRTDYSVIPNTESNLANCKYFKTNILEFDRKINKDYHSIDSFVIYISLADGFTVECDNGESLEVEKGESILLPAVFEEVKLIPKGNAKILEVYVP